MSLAEALVVVVLVGVTVSAMGGLTAGAVRARVSLEQDVVGRYALEGFLEEAARARPGVTPFAPLRLGRLRWVRRWVPLAERRGARAGPWLERRVTPDRVELTVRFDGALPRAMSGAVARGGSW